MTGVAPTLTDCSMIRSVCTSQGSNWGKKPIAIAHLGSRDGSLNGHTYQLCTAWSLTHSHTHETNMLVSDSQILSHTHWLLIAGQEVWADFVQDSRWNGSPTCRKHLHFTEKIFFYPRTHLARCLNCYWVGLAHFAFSFDNQQQFCFGHHGPLMAAAKMWPFKLSLQVSRQLKVLGRRFQQGKQHVFWRLRTPHLELKYWMLHFQGFKIQNKE